MSRQPALVFEQIGGSPCPGGLHQPTAERESQLLFGGMSGDRRGGTDGTGGQQQLHNLGRFLRQLRARHTEPLTVIGDNFQPIVAMRYGPT